MGAAAGCRAAGRHPAAGPRPPALPQRRHAQDSGRLAAGKGGAGWAAELRRCAHSRRRAARRPPSPPPWYRSASITRASRRAGGRTLAWTAPRTLGRTQTAPRVRPTTPKTPGECRQAPLTHWRRRRRLVRCAQRMPVEGSPLVPAAGCYRRMGARGKRQRVSRLRGAPRLLRDCGCGAAPPCPAPGGAPSQERTARATAIPAATATQSSCSRKPST